MLVDNFLVVPTTWKTDSKRYEGTVSEELLTITNNIFLLLLLVYYYLSTNGVQEYNLQQHTQTQSLDVPWCVSNRVKNDRAGRETHHQLSFFMDTPDKPADPKEVELSEVDDKPPPKGIDREPNRRRGDKLFDPRRLGRRVGNALLVGDC